MTVTLAVTVTDENGGTQEHDICTFDHYGSATTVNVDETQNGNQKQKECSNMNRNEPLYELSAWDWPGAHERLSDQHFVGKRLSNAPYAKATTLRSRTAPPSRSRTAGATGSTM